MNRLAVGIIVGIVVFIVTLAIFNGNYQGYNAQSWYSWYQSSSRGVNCVKGLYTVYLPDLSSHYNLTNIVAKDTGDSYYSEEQVKNCLSGL
jgi:hypothetical protein